MEKYIRHNHQFLFLLRKEKATRNSVVKKQFIRIFICIIFILWIDHDFLLFFCQLTLAVVRKDEIINYPSL